MATGGLQNLFLSFHIIPAEGGCEGGGGRCVNSAATPYNNRTEYTLL
jgi:hypothetical protein